MKKLSVLSLAVAVATLAACGGDNSPDKPNLCADVNVERCDQVIIPESSSSASSVDLQPPVNDLLPYTEKFAADNATQVFSAAYKSLLNTVAEDPNPAFLYPASGLMEARLAAGAGRLTIGNARFTIGQGYKTTGTHLNPNSTETVDYKVNTTTAGNDGEYPTKTTWGELDLSHKWKMSFCVEDWKHTGSVANNQLFMLYTDNNQSGKDSSIHGQKSLLVQSNVEKFVKGKRVEIFVPGDVKSNGVMIDEVFNNPGTTTSFLQVRVPSNANLTMSNLWIGYQNDTSTEPAADTCTVGAEVEGWNKPLPPIAPAEITLLPASETLRVSWPAASRAANYDVAYNTVDDVTTATIVANDITTTNFNITDLTNGTTYYVWVKAANAQGESEWSESFTGVPEVPATPPDVATGLVSYADDRRVFLTWDANEAAESFKVFKNTTNNFTGAEELAITTDNFYRVKGLVNDTPYYFFITAINGAGGSEAVAVSATPKTSAPNIYQANFDVTREQFFDSASNVTINSVPSVQTISYDNDQAMALVLGGPDNMPIVEVNGVRGLRVASSRFSVGQLATYNGDGTYTVPPETSKNASNSGTLNLTNNYKVCYTAIEKHTAGLLQIYLDNNTTALGSSVHGNPNRLVNQTIVDIPLNQEQCVELVDDSHYGTANSFIQVRVDSNGGTVGVVLSSLKIVDLGTAPIKTSISSSSTSSSSSSSVGVSSSAGNSSSSSANDGGSSSSVASIAPLTNNWTVTGSFLVDPNITAASGSVVSSSENSVTIKTVGGAVTASAFDAFISQQVVNSGNFRFSAKINAASVVGGSLVNSSNSYRFGLIAMKAPLPATVATYSELPTQADIGFYINNSGEFVGSRANTKTDGTRTRSDISGLTIGQYVAIEIYDDNGTKRVRRLTKGAASDEWVQANSTTDFRSDVGDNQWAVGFYGATGTNELTIEFTDIRIEAL